MAKYKLSKLAKEDLIRIQHQPTPQLLTLHFE